MLHIDCTFADCRLLAYWEDGDWLCTFFDAISGKRHNVKLAANDLATVMYVMTTGDDSGQMYDAAEAIVESFPRECRPIP